MSKLRLSSVAMVLPNRKKDLELATRRRATGKYALLFREIIVAVTAESINNTCVRMNTDRARQLFLLYAKEPCPTQFTAIGSLNHAHHLTHPRVRVVAMDTELSLINEELVKRVVCILDPACPVEDRQVHQKVRSNSNHRARSCELLPVATSIYISLSRSDNRRVQG